MLKQLSNWFTQRLLARRLAAAWRNKNANVAITTALVAPILLGAVSLGIETTYWVQLQRNLQNVADSAAIAAATNGQDTYANEAQAVASQFGFPTGTNNVTVTASSSVPCPSGGDDCYKVTLSKIVPLYLAQVVGFKGDTKLNGRGAKTISASAIAKRALIKRQYCVVALATSGTGIRSNGGPDAALAGCNVMSNAGATCNGHNLGADYGDAHLNNYGCGVVQTSNVPVASDPYQSLAKNIPTDSCRNFPQEPKNKHSLPLPSSNEWSGAVNLSGNTIVCGDLQLSGNVEVNAPSGATLIIENGQLDTNGYTLQTSSGSGLTVVFSGTSSAAACGNYTHAPTGGGTLDIAAPTSGPWSGVAIYQDPSLTSGVDISAAGNSPTWDITGLVYLPKANVTLSGAVNKASNGHSCFATVVNTLTVNGTGSILENGQCAAAGLNMPTNEVRGRGQLVG